MQAPAPGEDVPRKKPAPPKQQCWRISDETESYVLRKPRTCKRFLWGLTAVGICLQCITANISLVYHSFL